MNAAIRYRYCDPDQLKLERISTPQPSAHEILVQVKATTVNRTDCGVLTGKPYAIRLFTGLTKPMRPITGTDFAGEVVAVGNEVREFNDGDRVYGFYDEGLQSHAEYVTVGVSKPVRRIPAEIGFEEAVASLEGAHYAFYFLDKFKLSPGDVVLVNGGTGAIGNAAVQFLRYMGVEVTVTCATPDVPRLLEQGATEVIDYTIQDFTQLNRRFNAIFDAVGKSSFSACKRLLTPRGVYISSELGPNWQNPLLGLISPFMPGKKVKFPLPLSIHRSMAFIHDRISDGSFRPLIDQRFALADIGDAFRYVMSGQKKGNVLLTDFTTQTAAHTHQG